LRVVGVGLVMLPQQILTIVIAVRRSHQRMNVLLVGLIGNNVAKQTRVVIVSSLEGSGDFVIRNRCERKPLLSANRYKANRFDSCYDRFPTIRHALALSASKIGYLAAPIIIEQLVQK